jgi:DNA-binding response OmpR family regulator
MKILLIEDEHKIAHAIRAGLIQEHFTVDIAYDGATGYDMATEDGYNLIILDRLLPKMDGLTICKKLRKSGKHTPILLLTAKGQISDRVEGLQSGADDYLTKPFAFEELLARVHALLRRPQQLVSTIFTVDTLSLDTVSFEVARSGKKISLSAKEFALLEYLLRHANTIVKKEQIIQHVWNYDTNILPNTIEVFIGYLRNKIDKPFPKEKNLIKTVRGFGYKIEG